jgi:hypothetical protein
MISGTYRKVEKYKEYGVWMCWCTSGINILIPTIWEMEIKKIIIQGQPW